MSLEKSLCDDSETVVIEGCIASIFKATIEGVEDLSGIRIKAIQRIGEYELSLFTGTIDECPLQSDRKSRTITAYDDFYSYSDINVAEWYNSLNYPVNIADFLKSLLNYVGIPYSDTLDIRQSFEVNKTMDTAAMAFSTVIKSVCQVIGGFGVINPDGEFDIVYMSNEVYGQALNAMSGFELESYNVKAIDKVVVRSEETDIGGTCGEGSNAYIIQGNFLCFGMDADSIASVAAELYKNVAGFTWRPCLFELGVGNPLIGCDGMRYRVVTSQGDEFETYIFNSYISGVQLFNQELESFGSETRKEVVADDYTEALITAYKVMKIKATVDGFDLQIESKVDDNEIITRINASAEKILISSTKIDIAGLVQFINGDESDVTEIDGGRLKNKSISTDKLSVENLDAICANIGGFTMRDGKIVFLENSSYKDLNTEEEKMSYWYSFGLNPNSYTENEKVMWFGAHPQIVGTGMDEKGYYTEDALVYPFYITADGKIISNGEENEIIWGSGKSYQVSQLPGTTNLNWNVQSSVQYGQESLQIASGYILFNDITRINSSGIKCNDVNVLDFTNVGIYSPEINAEIIKAKESVITTKLWCEKVDASILSILDEASIGGNLTVSGDISVPITAKSYGNDSFTVPVSGAWQTLSAALTTELSKAKTFLGSYYGIAGSDTSASWSNIISVRHRSGMNDGNIYGMYLRSHLTANSSNLVWNRQSGNGWQGERTILDSSNYSGYAQSKITGAATSVVSSNLTASRALYSDASGKIAASSNVTSTELSYLDGVTSAIQTQLNGKQASIIGAANASNGYVRIPGLQIQVAWKRVSWSGAIATAWGNGYESASAISLGNWAASFATAPAVTYAVNSSTSTDVGITGYATPSTTSAGSVYLQRNTSLSTSRTYTIHVLAIGTYS